jgi:hypothetical protein
MVEISCRWDIWRYSTASIASLNHSRMTEYMWQWSYVVKCALQGGLVKSKLMQRILTNKGTFELDQIADVCHLRRQSQY